MEPRFYNIPVFGCVDPLLDGPYVSGDERDLWAKVIHAEQGEEDALFWLNIDKDGRPTVGAFTNADFEE